MTIWKNSHLQINNCTFKNFDTGIYIYGTSQDPATNNIINHSTFLGNDLRAIHFGLQSNNNKIINNNISDNDDYGIYFDTSTTVNNNITCNNLHSNADHAIYFNANGKNNTVYKNNFFGNNPSTGDQSYDNDGDNEFNVTGLGNFWDNFNDTSEGCVNSDGFCNSSYNLTKSRDNHPYVSRVSCEETVNNASNTAQVILNSTDIAINGSNQKLTCYTNITDTNGDQVYANFTWYNNSVEMVHLRGQYGPFTQGTLVNVANLTYKNTTSRQNWTCSIQAYDGKDYENDWNNATINIRDNCGHINSDLTLQNDVVSESTCFTINASDITLDCAGHNINYSYSGTKGFGINVSFNNVTIKNCNILEGTSTTIQKYAIWTEADNVTFENNTIITTGSYSYGIYLFAGSDQNKINHNNISTTSSNAYGIHLQAADSNVIQNNIIKSTSSNPIALRIFSTNNIFINNNLTSEKHYEIYDNSPSGTSNRYTNYLIYNNSYGKIKWLNNGSGSFIQNLTINVTNGQGIGLGKNLFIGNNSVALNTSAFNVGKINSSANITLKGLDLSSVNQIKKVGNFTASSSQIQSTGTNCDGTTCTIISYSNGILKFNTSYFSSFAGNFTEEETQEEETQASGGGGGGSEDATSTESTASEESTANVQEVREIKPIIKRERIVTKEIATSKEIRELIEKRKIKLEITKREPRENREREIQRERVLLGEAARIPEEQKREKIQRIPVTVEKEVTITITNDAEVPIKIKPKVTENVEVPKSLVNNIQNLKKVVERQSSSKPRPIVETKPPYVIRDISIDFQNKREERIEVKPKLITKEEKKIDNEDRIKEKLKENKELSLEEIEEKLETQKVIENKKVNFLSRGKSGRIPGISYLVDKKSGISYSGRHTSGNKLKNSFIDPARRSLNPGEQLDKIQITSGLSVEEKEEIIKVSLFSEGKELTEQEIKIKTKPRVGALVDLDKENNLLDIYMVVPKIKQSYGLDEYQLEVEIVETINDGKIDKSQFNENKITGSFIENEIFNTDEITHFGEIYGPYTVNHQDGLLIAQEFSYDEEQMEGEHKVKLKIFNREGLVAENIFIVNFNNETVTSKVSPTTIQSQDIIADKIKESVETVKLIESKNVKFLSHTKVGKIFDSPESLSYSGRSTSGDYLKIKVIEPKAKIINPGEKLEEVIKIRTGLTTETTEKKINIDLFSEGEQVFKKEDAIIEEPRRGGIFSLDAENNLLDIYMVIPKGEPTNKRYSFELNINKEDKSKFAELYGPYKIDEQGIILAQEFLYNDRSYQGDHVASLKLYGDGKLISENTYNLNFDIGLVEEITEEFNYKKSNKKIIIYLILLIIFLGTIILLFSQIRSRYKRVTIVNQKTNFYPKMKSVKRTELEQKIKDINKKIEYIKGKRNLAPIIRGKNKKVEINKSNRTYYEKFKLIKNMGLEEELKEINRNISGLSMEKEFSNVFIKDQKQKRPYKLTKKTLLLQKTKKLKKELSKTNNKKRK